MLFFCRPSSHQFGDALHSFRAHGFGAAQHLQTAVSSGMGGVQRRTEALLRDSPVAECCIRVACKKTHTLQVEQWSVQKAEGN